MLPKPVLASGPALGIHWSFSKPRKSQSSRKVFPTCLLRTLCSGQHCGVLRGAMELQMTLISAPDAQFAEGEKPQASFLGWGSEQLYLEEAPQPGLQAAGTPSSDSVGQHWDSKNRAQWF